MSSGTPSRERLLALIDSIIDSLADSTWPHERNLAQRLRAALLHDDAGSLARATAQLVTEADIAAAGLLAAHYRQLAATLRGRNGELFDGMRAEVDALAATATDLQKILKQLRGARRGRLRLLR